MSYCDYWQFSDTIILIGPRPDPHADSLVTTVLSARELLAAAITAGMPIRGAVTWGEINVDEPMSRFIGKGFLRAHELEHRQEWAGGIVDPALIAEDLPAKDQLDALVAKRALVRYDVPVKGGGTESHLAIDWAGRIHPEVNSTAILGNLLLWAPTDDDPRADRKLENTAAFCRRYDDGTLPRVHLVKHLVD